MLADDWIAQNDYNNVSKRKMRRNTRISGILCEKILLLLFKNKIFFLYNKKILFFCKNNIFFCENNICKSTNQ